MDSQHGHKDILPSEPPSDLYLRKLESLEAPPKPPVTVYRTEPRLQTLVKGLNSTDLEIARRLERLREDRRAAKAIPSEDEIAQRLAILRGEDEQSIFKKPSYAHLVPNKRSGEEQTQDLFTQCKEEVELERKFLKPEDDIAERLNRLRGTGGDNSQKSLLESTKVDVEVITLDEIAHLLAECKMEASESGKQLDLATVVSLEKLRARIVQQNKKKDEDCVSDEDEEEAAAKILSRIQAEVDLEEKFCSGKTSNEEDEIMDTDNNTAELPWCVICNEDAKLRCLGCDRDLFCKSCFQEGHRDDDMKSHSFEVYGKK